MKVIRLEDVSRVKVDMEGASGAWKQVPLSRDDGAPLFSFRVFTIEPGGHTPYHQHPFEHLNYIIEGRGSLVSESGAKNPITRGDFAMVMPDEMHQYRNESEKDPLMVICAVPVAYE